MTTIPDHVGREAVRLMNETYGYAIYRWPLNRENTHVITVAKLLMNPPAPMTDPDEEAAKRVIAEWCRHGPDSNSLTRATEQMRKEREAWEAGQ
jgi:hypothetical protein